MELDDYVNDLLPRLINLLENHKSVKVQEECLFALASIIGGAQNLIGHTLFPILDTCKTIICNRTTDEEVELRANALDCVAHIAFVIKLEKFEPYMPFFTKFASECIKSDKYEFQDAGFMYFGAVAGIVGDAIATDLPILMECAFAILKDDSGLTTNKDKDEFGLDSDSEEEEGKDEGKIEDVYVNDAFVDAKCSVILAITNFAKASPTSFVNYIQDVFINFESLWNYVHDNVNLEMIMAYQSLIVSINDAEEKIKLVNSQTGDNTESLAKKIWVGDVFPKYERVFEESDLKEEVCKVLESVHEIINHFGKSLFINNNTLEKIIGMCVSLLENKANLIAL